GIPDPHAIFYPNPQKLSRGKRHRVKNAKALSCRPAGLIADQHTTPEEVTNNAHKKQQINLFQKENEMGVIFKTSHINKTDPADEVSWV
ncbi:glutathione ABC transporter ATP-binding protein GsiA, partial [Enterobacter hormaechei]